MSCGLHSPRAMRSVRHCSFPPLHDSPLLWTGCDFHSFFSVFRLETGTLEITVALFHNQQGQREIQLQTPLGLPWANRTGTVMSGTSRDVLGISRAPLPDILNLGS